jgi:hypothetical protein
MSDTNTTPALNISKIDAAIAAAKARKAAREAALQDTSPTSQDPVVIEPGDGSDVSSSYELTDADKRQSNRAAKKAMILADREARRAAKAAERSTKKETKVAQRTGPAHMSKVDKAAAKLPTLLDETKQLFNDITQQLHADQVTALVLHLQHHNRVNATQRALTAKVETGTAVRIVGGDPKFIGRTGVVFKAQRIRCYVTVPGVNRPVYLFTSDVTPVELETVTSIPTPTESTGTDG